MRALIVGLGALALGTALWRLGERRTAPTLRQRLAQAVLGGGGLQATLHGAWTDDDTLLGQLTPRLLGLSMLLVLGGAVAARRCRGVPGDAIAALCWQAMLAFGVVLGGTLLGGASTPPPEALFGHAVVGPVLLMVLTYLGASLGFLAWGDGRRQAPWRTEWWVARRFLLSRASPVLSVVTGISMTGVALGVWLVLLTLGILGGFEHDLEGKIIGAGAPVVIEQLTKEPFADGAALQQRLAALRADGRLAVTGETRLLAAEVAIASDSQYTAALMTGVDVRSAPAVIEVLRTVSPTARGALLQDAERLPVHPPLLLGREMARSLNVKVGDRVRVIAPTLEVLSPLGPTPKSRPFVVAGIFASHMYDYDAHHAYVSLCAARHFLELGPAQITGIGLQCRDPQRTLAVRRAFAATRPAGPEQPALRTLDWRERNQTLFAALTLEHRVAFVVLIFIVLVASFSIVNTLTMAVLERQRDIAILKAMGAHDVSTVKIFVLQGLLIGGVGVLLGGAFGVASLWVLQRVGFAIPGDFYYIDSLPVQLDGGAVAAVLAAALVLVWNFAVLPSLRCAALRPVEGLRDG